MGMIWYIALQRSAGSQKWNSILQQLLDILEGIYAASGFGSPQHFGSYRNLSIGLSLGWWQENVRLSSIYRETPIAMISGTILVGVPRDICRFIVSVK